MDQEDSVSTGIWLEKHSNTQTDHTQPGANTYCKKKLSLSKQLTAKITQFSKSNSMTASAIIHAAYGILLSRLSSGDITEFGIGVGVLSKNSLSTCQKADSLQFTFVDTTTISAYLQHIKKSLGKKSKKKSNARYLFLTCKSTAKTSKTIPLNADEHPLVILLDHDDVSHGQILFNENNFTAADIKFIDEHLKLILENLCVSQEKDKVTEISLLTKSDRMHVLQDWKTSKVNDNIPFDAECCHDQFIKQAMAHPENIAVTHNDELYTYSDLLNISNSIVNTLISKNIKAGDRVCVFMDRTSSLLAAMMAIFRCGGIFVPVNPKYPEDRIEYVLQDSAPSIILANEANKLADKYKDITCIIQGNLRVTNEKLTTKLNKVSPDSVAYIVYTSGTTGKPKGVMIQHKSLINFIHWYKLCFNINNQDVASQFASQGFDSFFCETIPFMSIGATISIVDDSIKLTPNLFFDWLVKSKITVCDITTAYAQILFYMEWPTDIKLRLIKIGGEALSHYPDRAFSFDIWNTYGPTETTIESTYIKIYDANSPPLFATNKSEPPIGKPIINSEMYIVDKNFQLVPPGIVGELLIGGENVSPGYLNRSDITAERFITIKVDNKTTNKLYRTGDLVKWLDDGNLEFIGRIDHQVKIRGYRIEPAEIEHEISLHPDVKEVTVVAKDSVNNQKTIIAYVLPNLDKERFLYQQRCLISIDKDHFFEAITDDISKEGVSVSGVADNLIPGTHVKIHIKLPGMNESKAFKAQIIWVVNHRCGLQYIFERNDQDIISKSIQHYLSNHNVMDMILSNSAKRSLKKALQKKMPEYMIPAAFVKLLEFPLNYSGKIDVKSLPPPQSMNELFRDKYVAPETDTEIRLSAIWSELLDINDISMSDNFFDLGGDSISAAKLSINILKEFKITIPVNLLFDLSFIPILAEYIDSNGKKYSATSSIQDDINRDSELSDLIHPTTKLTPNIDNPQNILLTGAGGFLGIFLLRDLLKNPNAKIYCLIRQGEFETAAQRLNATIAKFNLEDGISLNDKRIIIIPSDISQDRFGMPEDHYNSLLNKIDIIFHCGAQVNIMASYGKLRGSNVQGTLEVIKFATSGQNKPIHYVSTLSSAYRKDKNGLLVEEFPTETYEHLFGGYAISKWVSERLLTQIKNRGLPVTLYRSGYIFGNSKNGITSVNDALLMLIKGCIQIGCAPIMEECISLLPVDFVSKAITSIALSRGAHSGVYHVDHPTGIMWSDLVSWLNDYGYKIKQVPMKKWQLMLEKIGTDNALFPFLPYYLSLDEAQVSPRVNVHKALAILDKLSIEFPKINDELLNIYFDYLCEVDFLPAPKASYRVKS